MTPLERALLELPRLLSAHVQMSALASLLAVVLSVPLGLLVVRRPRWRALVLAAAGVVQTIPGLALLALMVPLLGAFGFWPALVALVLYAVLPILRNTVTGIQGVDPAVLEAADAMGMTAGQRLAQVELPLALPVIVAGVRTAVVWTVGMATLSTPVGQPSLGNYIFAGLQTRNEVAVLVGCVAAALLALVLDALLGLLGQSLERRRRPGALVACAGLSLVLLAGSLAPLLDGAPRAAARALHPAPGTPSAGRPALARVRVGAKTFTEQYILASVIEARLVAAGLSVERRDSLGSNVAFDALQSGDIDVYVEYTGTIWSSYMRRDAPESSWRTLALTSAWLLETHGVRLLGPLGFENAYCIAMRRDRAAALGIQSLADLGRHGGALSLGSDYEFFGRPEWARLEASYQLQLGRKASYDPSLMYSALVSGEVDMITAFSSDGHIEGLDLVVLPDVAGALPPYDAVLLLSPRAADDTAIVAALQPLVGAISAARMRRANHMVDRDSDARTPEQAAAWLLEAIGGSAARP